MRMKVVLIIKLAISVVINITLFSIFFKSPFITRVVILPFLACGIAMMGQVIFLLAENQKYYQLFGKVYVIIFFTYWFGFLLFWCYYNTIHTNYLLALCSIPFWLLGFNTIKVYLFSKKDRKQKK